MDGLGGVFLVDDALAERVGYFLLVEPSRCGEAAAAVLADSGPVVDLEWSGWSTNVPCEVDATARGRKRVGESHLVNKRIGYNIIETRKLFQRQSVPLLGVFGRHGERNRCNDVLGSVGTSRVAYLRERCLLRRKKGRLGDVGLAAGRVTGWLSACTTPGAKEKQRKKGEKEKQGKGMNGAAPSSVSRRGGPESTVMRRRWR